MTFAVIGGCESPTKAEGDIAVDDDWYPCTPRYAAPELFYKHKLAYAKDYNDELLELYHELYSDKSIDERVDIYSAAKSIEFIYEIAGLSNDLLEQLLKDCTRFDRDLRPNIDDCISRMEEILHHCENANSQVCASLNI